MVLSLAFVASAFGLACAVFIVGIRAPSLRALILEILSRIRGIPIMWIESVPLAALVLKASAHKGMFLERTFSTPAWSPVISMESIDGPEWNAMKVNLVKLMKVLPSASALESIAHRLTNEYMLKIANDPSRVLDSPAIAYLSVASFFEYIFQRPFNAATDMFVCDATWEWRKEIALKGKADINLKWKVVHWILEHVEATPWLYDLFGAKWREPAYFSLLLQPFIVSPAINITDIAVRVHQVYSPAKTMTDVLHVAIDTAHPFVLFERYLENGLEVDNLSIPPGTHVFIPVDTMTTDSVIRFGAGVRRCPGAHIGMACMLGMFTPEIVTHPKFRPAQGHLYSGRDQDGKETLGETLRQVEMVVTALWRAYSVKGSV